MADESSKFNFFGLGPRPREMITDMLKLKEKYILAKLSRKWRDEVKARNYTFEKIEYRYRNDDWHICIENVVRLVNNSLTVCVFGRDCGPQRFFNTNSLTEQAADPRSVKSQVDQVEVVTNRLMDLVTFQSTEIELTPHPELEIIINQLSRFDHKVTEGTVKIDSSYEALPRSHLSAVLRTFSGRELHIGQVEQGVEEDLPMNFEKIYVTGNMWMTMNMLSDNNAREIHIQYDREPEDRSIMFSGSLIYSWLNGRLSNLEHFSINVFVFELWADRVARMNYLNALLRRFPQIPRPDDVPNNGSDAPFLWDNADPPLDFNPDNFVPRVRRPEERGIFVQRQDGKRAHAFLKMEQGIMQFVFKPW